MEITAYELTMNVEQDSTGNTEYVAALYTPAIGLHQGRGASPENAILALAGKIRQEQNRKSFAGAIANALNQPFPSTFPGNHDVPETVADISAIKNVGKIVHYTPGAGDVEDAGQVLPAIITREWPGSRMDLQVFGNKVTGTSTRYSVEWSASGNSGTWDWMKKG
jgi:hypothetical protein